jgi:hypothetical protein
VAAPGAPRAGASATRLEGQGTLSAWILTGWHPTARRKAAEAALIPPNCPLCEEAYRDPIKTDCGHYFCADCVLPRYQHGSSEGRKCPLCAEHLNGSFTIAEDLSARLRDQFNAPSLDQVEARCPHVPRTASQQCRTTRAAIGSQVGARREDSTPYPRSSTDCGSRVGAQRGHKGVSKSASVPWRGDRLARPCRCRSGDNFSKRLHVQTSRSLHHILALHGRLQSACALVGSSL